ncbi:TonB-dependent receptor [Candidatus Sulfidibacterium hydrothermale]|uniref:TonB-dependent receptor n=1 Tax=Candidatus Sulfidibacterium hydrothermale TaxID=2875962 RepID=UPI001F0A7FD3|nr:TonB-dependent receptor [Candidatus Sulfidibacterium hydrothermale]UBM61608.1 TonB-dependent receptor [Candidatus Sulfidibacterium hydrothermale]
MKRTNLLLTLLVSLVFAGATFAQGVVQGIVMDANSHETLVGATVVVEGTTAGITTNLDGSFTLIAPAGNQKIKVSYVGYEPKEISLTIKNGATYNLGKINLKSSSIGLQQVNVLASVAVDRKTPVAVSTINSKTISNNLGTRDLPAVMVNTPNVYVTPTGGGYGDSRINVRGFDQRNVAVLINGIPVNDMENGWVYWSNWAGLGDATRTIQIQRGLGASKLAINSVGGTINIITKTSDMNKGGSIYMSTTDYGLTKEMLTLSTGKLKSGTSITFVGSHTSGTSYIDATWVKAWSYFLSVSQEINKNNQLVFTLIGAPQEHGQRNSYYMLTQEMYDKYGPKYNENWGWRGGELLNERVNYYHKPQMALNWYWKINDKAHLATSAYYSFGTGGGSGPLGYNTTGHYYKYEPPKTAFGQYDWDAMGEWNANNIDTANAREVGAYTVYNGDTTFMARSQHIIRNSVNNHQWYGLLSTLNYNFSDMLKLTAGIDFRHYKGEHYREVRDLLGGDYWYDYKFGATKVGDKIAYWNDGIVTYGGLFAQLEYTKGIFNAFATGTFSNTWDTRVDYYNYTPGVGERSETLSNVGYDFKLGANVNISERSNFFLHGGFYSRVPFFRFMFLNYTNEVNTELKNEKISAIEAGYNYIAPKFTARVNVYYTVWSDISLLTGFVADNGSYVNAFMSNLKEVHKGIEITGTWKANRWMRLGGMINLGDWRYANDATARLYDDQTHQPIGTGTIYTDNLRIGDQPQNSFGAHGSFKITRKITLSAHYLYYANLYAHFTPETRKDPNDRAQAYKLPNYGMLNMRLGWAFKIAGMDSYFNWNVYNVTDNITLVEAEDQYDAATGTHVFKKGFWSWGRNMNFSLKIKF